MNTIGIRVSAALFVALFGCTISGDPIRMNGGARVDMSIGISGIRDPIAPDAEGGLVDSIRIDSAVVVFWKVKFEDHFPFDSLDEGMGEDDDEQDEEEGESILGGGLLEGLEDHEGEDANDRNIIFRGPYAVVVRDTILVDLGSEVLPAGTYSSVKMKVHRLKPWDRHVTVDRAGRHGDGPKLYLSSTGSSILAWGSMSKDGIWHPFDFAFDGEFHARRQLNLNVTEDLRVVPIAFHVDARQWFVDPKSGFLLDPHDLSPETKSAFRHAIQISFYTGRCEKGENYEDES